jgi:DNA-binding beta-propeller fold protein YncE
VANTQGNDLTEINGQNNSTQSITVGSYPAHVAVNQTTNKIYVAFQIPGNTGAVDGETGATTTIPAGSFENEIVVDEWRNKIYVADPTGNQLVVIDGPKNTTTTAPGTGSYLWRIAVNPLTNEIYAANLLSGDATIYAGAPAKLPVTLLESIQH